MKTYWNRKGPQARQDALRRAFWRRQGRGDNLGYKVARGSFKMHLPGWPNDFVGRPCTVLYLM